MNVEVFTLCWNEIAVLPFAVDYWRRYASRVTVYDNGSTDGSLEFMQQHSDLITIKHFDTNGRKDNTTQMVLKNMIWKEARDRADLVVVCDLDEMLIPRPGALERMMLSGGTICEPIWYELVSEEMPKHEECKWLHEIRPMAVMPRRSERMPTTTKAVLFNPNAIDEMGYGPGSHVCCPIGDVRWYQGDIYLLHVNNALSLEYRLARYRAQAERRSLTDIKRGYGIHYTKNEAKITREWVENTTRMVNFGRIIG